MKKISTMSIIALVTAMLGACQNNAAVTKAPATADKTTQKVTKVKKAKPVDYTTLTKREQSYINQLKITAIGDSVMEGSAYKYKEVFSQMNLNTSVSRQIYELADIERSMIDQGQMADTLLIGLGTNGTYTPEQMAQIMQVAGTKRTVFWINVHTPDSPWEEEVNAALAKSAKKYQNLTIIDWAAYSKDHNDWFVADHTHPTTDGINSLVTFVAKNIALKNL